MMLSFGLSSLQEKYRLDCRKSNLFESNSPSNVFAYTYLKYKRASRDEHQSKSDITGLSLKSERYSRRIGVLQLGVRTETVTRK